MFQKDPIEKYVLCIGRDTNEFDGNSGIMHNTKCENEKKGETGQLAVLNIFLLVVSIIYVLIDMAHGELISIAIFIAIYLFSCLINVIAIILALFDRLVPFACDTTTNYHVCLLFLIFVENFLHFEFVNLY